MRIRIRMLVVATSLLVSVQGFCADAPVAPAPAGPVYSVLSLVGDKLELVLHELQTGSHLDTNGRQEIPINDPVFDSAAAMAAGNAVRDLAPDTKVTALNTRTKVLFEKQDSLFSVSGETMSMPDAIKDALREQGATRLILIGKQRATPYIPYEGGTYEASGRLEGLGYYIDKTWGMVDHDKQNNQYTNDGGGSGFIAPYAYLQVTLVELPSGRVLGRKKVKSAFMVDPAKTKTDDFWGSLPPDQKIQLVKTAIAKAVAPAVKELVSAAK